MWSASCYMCMWCGVMGLHSPPLSLSLLVPCPQGGGAELQTWTRPYPTPSWRVCYCMQSQGFLKHSSQGSGKGHVSFHAFNVTEGQIPHCPLVVQHSHYTQRPFYDLGVWKHTYSKPPCDAKVWRIDIIWCSVFPQLISFPSASPVSTIGFGFVLDMGFFETIKLLLWVVFIDCVGVGLLIATLMWWVNLFEKLFVVFLGENCNQIGNGL